MIIWTDIESTGLIPDKGVILELAMLIADPKIPTDIVQSESWVVPWTEADLENLEIDPFVFEMHSKNGLWEDVLAESDFCLSDIELQACKFLDEHAPGDGHIMAGASVGSFDLVWLRRHMPLLAARFSHRVLDTTSVRMFACDLGACAQAEFTKGEAHRALADCTEAVNHYRRAFAAVQGRFFKE